MNQQEHDVSVPLNSIEELSKAFGNGLSLDIESCEEQCEVVESDWGWGGGGAVRDLIGIGRR